MADDRKPLPAGDLIAAAFAANIEHFLRDMCAEPDEEELKW